jgi:hypothetical protein
MSAAYQNAHLPIIIGRAQLAVAHRNLDCATLPAANVVQLLVTHEARQAVIVACALRHG